MQRDYDESADDVQLPPQMPVCCVVLCCAVLRCCVVCACVSMRLPRHDAHCALLFSFSVSVSVLFACAFVSSSSAHPSVARFTTRSRIIVLGATTFAYAHLSHRVSPSRRLRVGSERRCRRHNFAHRCCPHEHWRRRPRRFPHHHRCYPHDCWRCCARCSPHRRRHHHRSCRRHTAVSARRYTSVMFQRSVRCFCLFARCVCVFAFRLRRFHPVPAAPRAFCARAHTPSPCPSSQLPPAQPSLLSF